MGSFSCKFECLYILFDSLWILALETFKFIFSLKFLISRYTTQPWVRNSSFRLEQLLGHYCHWFNNQTCLKLTPLDPFHFSAFHVGILSYHSKTMMKMNKEKSSQRHLWTKAAKVICQKKSGLLVTGFQTRQVPVNRASVILEFQLRLFLKDVTGKGRFSQNIVVHQKITEQKKAC